ncbi:MAG: hypothetical protein HZC12_00160 [Nitrospirae bacterium]|nr:hypothetical protein [Nitrospirota bacterium]
MPGVKLFVVASSLMRPCPPLLVVVSSPPFAVMVPLPDMVFAISLIAPPLPPPALPDEEN